MTGLRTAIHGAMSARIAPPLHIPAKPMETRPLRDRLTDALRAFPRTTSGLASELDVKELSVIHALANMLDEGVVVAGSIPTEGRRGQLWRLA